MKKLLVCIALVISTAPASHAGGCIVLVDYTIRGRVDAAPTRPPRPPPNSWLASRCARASR